MQKLLTRKKDKPKAEGNHNTSRLISETGESVAMSRAVAPVTLQPRTGMHILATPKGDLEAKIDIVFVHGLTGDYERTWTSTAPLKCFWPKELLPDDIEAARIMSWGYNAGVAGASARETLSANRIKDHALDLCTALAHLRTENEVRKVFCLCPFDMSL